MVRPTHTRGGPLRKECQRSIVRGESPSCDANSVRRRKPSKTKSVVVVGLTLKGIAGEGRSFSNSDMSQLQCYKVACNHSIGILRRLIYSIVYRLTIVNINSRSRAAHSRLSPLA